MTEPDPAAVRAALEEIDAAEECFQKEISDVRIGTRKIRHDSAHSLSVARERNLPTILSAARAWLEQQEGKSDE